MSKELGEDLFSRVSGEMLDRKNRRVIDSTLTYIDEDELLVTENDPCHCFICIEDVPDPDSPKGYFEISCKTCDEIQELEERTECENKLIIFTEIEYGNHFGRIISALIDAETGIITLVRENTYSETLTIIEEEKELELHCDDGFENLYPTIKGKRMLCRNFNDRDNECKKFCHDNLKTFSDSKLQRMHRSRLRTARRKF